MGLFDFIFKRGKEEPKPAQPQPSPSHPQPTSTPKPKTAAELTIEPFIFKSNCHQRYNHRVEEMGPQLCIRTVSVEKNINGCRGYKLSPGDGYIVKVFNDDLNKPNMSDKPMRIVSKTADKVELRGFPIEAQTPFGWQEVDYRDYGFTIHYTNGKISKCMLHMFDRGIDLEYMYRECKTVESGSRPSVKAIANGAPFELNTTIRVVKQNYNNTSSNVDLGTPVNAKIQRTENNGAISITFGDLNTLRKANVIQNNLELRPNFQYNSDADGDEFASAEINNSFSAIASGNEYVTLFQITKQKGKIISFIINNLPNAGDYYYLIMFQ